MTRKQKLLSAGAGCIAFYTIFGFFILSMILTRMVPQKMAELLNRSVTIEKIQFNPYSLSATVKNLNIKDTNASDDFISLKQLYINIEILSLFKRGLVVREVRMETPKITIARLSGASFNFSELLAGHDKKSTEDKLPSKPFLFDLSAITIVDGTFIYRDEPFQKTHTVSDINWQLPHISNFIKNLDRYSEPVLACDVDGATLSVNVKTKPFKDTQETVVDLNLTGIQVPHYTAYIPPDKVVFQVNRGMLNIGAQVSFRKETDIPHVTLQGDLTLSDLEVTDSQDRDVLTLPKLSINILPSEILDNRFHIGSVQIESPEVSGLRKADGVINLTRLISGKSKSSDSKADQHSDTTPESEGSVTPDSFDGSKEINPLLLSIDEFRLTGGSLEFSDVAAGSDLTPVETTIRNVDLTVTNFSTRPGTTATVQTSSVLNGSSQINLEGSISAEPVSAKAEVNLSDFNMTWCQPYLPESVALVITKGLASVSGHVDLSIPADGPMSLTVTGNTSIKDFASVDPEKAKSFVQWSDFNLSGINVSMEPLRISVDEVAFSHMNNQLVIFEDGVSNIARIFVQKDDTQKTDQTPSAVKPDEAAPVVPIRIGKVSMSNTELGFIDRSISPRYATRLNLKDLLVTGLTSEDFKAATVKAGGAIDGYAPVSITGSINPLAKDLFVDLDVSFSNIEMVPFSPYTGKFIGQAIGKGKLSLDVKYQIKDKAINADNHLFLDQFTLGKYVDSPDTLGLPVGLAVALLQDQNGYIDVAMPISGRTDDPDFQWGGLAVKALVNLIMKAATSPFSLVGSLVGGGEELRYIEFQPGFSELDDANLEKLNTLKTLLVERPGLKLEIVGYVDTEADREALIDLALQRKIKSSEIIAAAKKGEQVTPETITAIVLSPQAREASLKKIYKNEILSNPKKNYTPKTLSDPTLTSDEMVTALKQALSITKTELRMLAMNRAKQVKSAILTDRNIQAKRVFLKEADTLSPEAPAGFKTSRAEIGLK